MRSTSLLLTFLFIIVCVMGVTHLVALELALYFIYPWLDIPMHFFGGAAAALGFLLLPAVFPSFPERYRTLLPTLAFVACVGLLWELFEIKIGIPVLQPGFGVDMIGDLFVDVVGGFTGYTLGQALIKLA